MTQINYELTRDRGKSAFVKVRLGRKVIGRIVAVEGGYQYWPENRKKYADPDGVRASVTEVKALIEGD